MLGDTIFAVASPPGAARRGVIRVSGPDALRAAARALPARLPRERACVESTVDVLGHRVRCLVLTMPAPASYTGEDVVELHVPGGPLLLDEVCRALRPDARLATPGEFTRRAFENGRLDLAAAEAVLELIHAADLEAGRFALDVLRGGLATEVERIRAAIQDALAMIEAGLDFTEGETGAVLPEQWLPHVVAARRRCEGLLAGLPRTGIHGEVLLRGAVNAGKSSLANALFGHDAALVAPVAGTTRDVLAFELAPGLRLLDGPGDWPVGQPVAEADRAAIDLRDRLAGRVAAVVEVLDATRVAAGDAEPSLPTPAPCGAPPVIARVLTKVDLLPLGAPRTEPWAPAGTAPPTAPPVFPVSSRTGEGIDGLRAFLSSRAGGGPGGLGTRLHDAFAEALAALDRVLAGAAVPPVGVPPVGVPPVGAPPVGAPPVGGLPVGGLPVGAAPLPDELVALELGAALAALDRVSGRCSPEDLLDRIFRGFCLGK